MARHRGRGRGRGRARRGRDKKKKGDKKVAIILDDFGGKEPEVAPSSPTADSPSSSSSSDHPCPTPSSSWGVTVGSSLVDQVSFLRRLLTFDLSTRQPLKPLKDAEIEDNAHLVDVVPPVLRSEMLRVFDTVGGRIGDLSEVCRRSFSSAVVKSPLEALADVQHEAERQVRRLTESAQDVKSTLGVFDVIRLLSAEPSGRIPYGVARDKAFGGDTRGLDALIASTPLLLLEYDPETQARSVAAASPLFHSACIAVANDHRVIASMSKQKRKARLEKVEEEIVVLMAKMESVFSSSLPSRILSSRKTELTSQWNALIAEKAALLHPDGPPMKQ